MSILAMRAAALIAVAVIALGCSYSVGFDRASLRYVKMMADADARAVDRLFARERELQALGDMRVAEVEAIQRQRKPVEREVIRYVANDKAVDDSRCAITDNGMQLVERYAIASSLIKD